MIAYIQGNFEQKEPAFVIVDVDGIGYEIRISLYTYSVIKNLQKGKLHTFLHIKEDAHTLYGFSDTAEKSLFMDLISISGIGPGTAMMMLSSLSSEEIKQAIADEDVKTIQSIKGIGGKTAQRVILELKDKMKKEGLKERATDLVSPEHNTIKREALSALVTLGIHKSSAEKNIEGILRKQNDISLENLIKLALKNS